MAPEQSNGESEGGKEACHPHRLAEQPNRRIGALLPIWNRDTRFIRPTSDLLQIGRYILDSARTSSKGPGRSDHVGSPITEIRIGETADPFEHAHGPRRLPLP
jgi:hypothetical protein